MSVNTQKAVKSKKDDILQALKLKSQYAKELSSRLGMSLQLTNDLLRELESVGQAEKYGSLAKPVWRLR